ncbi:MAG: universal stress protein, partial [Maioricimonas sp. JB049]
MIRLKSLLWPTDFSDCARQAQKYALAFAEQFDAHLHLLHVIREPSVDVPEFGMGLAFPAYVENLPKRLAELENQSIEKLTHSVPEHWQEGRHVTIAVKQGPPFMEIIRYAKEHETDMIVLGTHGRSALTHVLLGSVAER